MYSTFAAGRSTSSRAANSGPDRPGITTSGEVAVVWTERGGPPVSAPTEPGGFGSKLVSRSLGQQLGGSIAYEWPPEGAVVTLRMGRARLAA